MDHMVEGFNRGGHTFFVRATFLRSLRAKSRAWDWDSNPCPSEPVWILMNSRFGPNSLTPHRHFMGWMRKVLAFEIWRVGRPIFLMSAWNSRSFSMASCSARSLSMPNEQALPMELAFQIPRASKVATPHPTSLMGCASILGKCILTYPFELICGVT